ADALAEDLAAFVEGRPIAARPPTLRYVLGLAIRRNKAAAAAIFVALVALLAGGAVFVRSIESARRRAGEARLTAEAIERRAERLLDSVLFELRDELEPMGRLDALDKVATGALEYYRTLPVETMPPAEQRRVGVARRNLADVLVGEGRLPEALASD